VIDITTVKVAMIPSDARGDHYSVNWTRMARSPQSSAPAREYLALRAGIGARQVSWMR
jgi:hypothetical protein